MLIEPSLYEGQGVPTLSWGFPYLPQTLLPTPLALICLETVP